MIDFNVNKSNINQVKTLNKDDLHSNLKFLNPIKTDFVSFTAIKSEQYVDTDVFRNLKKLSEENPIIGFKGDGNWLLPNLSHVAGRKFTLYMPNGQQLSCRKTDSNNFILFSLKKNVSNEKSESKVRVPSSYNQDSTVLSKTKNEQIIKFRVFLQDYSKYGESRKLGQIEKIKKLDSDTYEEVYLLTSKEKNDINNILKQTLPYFF